MKTKYRFLTKDEFGNDCHRHQILVKEEWKDITGGSSIVGVLDKPLTWWASGLAVGKLGWLNSKASTQDQRINAAEDMLIKYETMSPEQYVELLEEAYRAHSVKLTDSAEAGTDMHSLLENYVKMCLRASEGVPVIMPEGVSDYIINFSDFAVKYIKRFLWSEAHCYDEKLFVGGISDVGAEMLDGSYAIIDFKSSKEAYFSHFIQVGIYDLLIKKHGLVNSVGKKVLKLDKPVSKYFIIPFGAKEFTVHENANVQELQDAAKACITLYRTKAHFEGK